MEDWFNRIGEDKTEDTQKHVGRIFQDNGYTPDSDFTDGFSKRSFEDFNTSPTQRIRRDYDDTVSDESYENDKPIFADASRKRNYSDSFATAELDYSSLKAQIEAKESSRVAVYEKETEISEYDDISSKRSRPVSRKGKSKTKKIVMSLIAIVLVIALAFGGYAMNLFSKVNYTPDVHKENQYISDSELACDDDVYNILLIGTDERASQANYRSDTMILVSIDKKNKKLKLSSFLRDTWVYIPGKDTNAKLNASCTYGGPQMVMDTIEYHFKVRIDKFVLINFDVFKTVINDLGGITLTITEAEAANITKEGHFDCKPGTRTVKGKTALWYARIRHLDSDFNRTARQRKVIQAVIDKAKKSSVTTLMTVLNDVLPEIQTDLNKTDIAKLGVNALLKYIKYDIEEQQIPAKNTWSNAWVGSQQVLKADIDKNAELLKEFIYG